MITVGKWTDEKGKEFLRIRIPQARSNGSICIQLNWDDAFSFYQAVHNVLRYGDKKIEVKIGDELTQSLITEKQLTE